MPKTQLKSSVTKSLLIPRHNKQAGPLATKSHIISTSMPILSSANGYFDAFLASDHALDFDLFLFAVPLK